MLRVTLNATNMNTKGTSNFLPTFTEHKLNKWYQASASV